MNTQEMELIQDINLLNQYIVQLKNAESMEEINRYNSMCKKKLDEVFKDKKKIAKSK
ncbi:MAG: hypothetical protein IJM34_07130 [Lachnospiraceae bacterium]|nr:hypothetical protein [Lachnospiraceae bacterium]